MTGLEPARPCEHSPLKAACLPISPHALYKVDANLKKNPSDDGLISQIW